MGEAIQTFERLVLRYLFTCDKPADPYIFHEMYRLSPGQIYTFIEKFSEKRFVSYSDGEMQLTGDGRKFVWLYRHDLFSNFERDKWRPATEATNWKDFQPSNLLSPHYNWLDRSIYLMNEDEFRNHIGVNSSADG